MTVFWKALAGALLLALGLFGWGADGQVNGRGKKKVLGSSTFYLGQSKDIWRPLVQITVKFSDITSINSSFQFRTFDPEGVIFYGDTKGGEDWFVLSLRDGIPLMQIEQLGTQVSVAGGPKLNDGKWHTLVISNQGGFVILEVDGSSGLVVGMKGPDPVEIAGGHLRMALGGILIDKKRLKIQFEPQMDGCVREGVWLNISLPWETEVDELWPCYGDIQPGSYFPGSGFAVLNTSVFFIDENDGVEIELQGNFSLMDGTILSIKAPGQDTMFTLKANNNTKELTLTYGESQMNTSSLLRTLWMKFEKNSLTIRAEEGELSSTPKVFPESHPDYQAAWRTGLFAIGGLLGGGEDSVGSQFLTGCLKKINVQGKDLDLDLAVKHMSISSHSCPG